MARPPLRPSKSPNLIVARPEYSQEQQELFKNQLRLYFTEVDNIASALLGPSGLQYLQGPHIAVLDNTDQYATANDTPTLITWDTLTTASGFTLQAPGSLICQVSGIYKLNYNAQLINNYTDAQDAVFWLKRNNVDIVNSATVFSLAARKSAIAPTFVDAYSEVVFEVDAGDEIELYWATDKAATSGGTLGIYIWHEAAWTVPPNPYVRPAVPSIIGSITFVSRLPT